MDALSADGGSEPVVEFNPWHFGNAEALTEAFFDQLGIVLGKSPGEKRAQMVVATVSEARGGQATGWGSASEAVDSTDGLAIPVYFLSLREGQKDEG